MIAIVDVENMTTQFNGVTVHKDLNLVVEARSIVALVGPSGCGKTTLLRSIMGLQRPVSGSIKVFGIDILTCTEAEMESVRMRWGVLFQQGALFSSLTVLENITFPMRILARLNKKDSATLARLKIAMVGLPPHAADLYPAELSGGMIKRAALARALALDPELLLLDEPTTGLDPGSTEDFYQLLLDLRRSLGFTVIMVSHDLGSLNGVVDSVAVMGEKKILINATINEIEKSHLPSVQTFFSGMMRRRANE
jgi:phospholipid/cholesterol/gamma-HCH transport system ATP-binding protein